LILLQPGGSQQKSYYITTLGCPKNIADSQHMEESLLMEGLIPAKTPLDSDYHLINTCTFITSATEETIDTILSAAKIKKKRKQKLVVVGCFAERFPDAIRDDIPEVDLCFGTGKYKDAGKLIKTQFPSDFKNINEINDEIKIRESIFKKKSNKPFSFIKVSDGCNRGCSFCIIPSLRGEFKDYSPENILLDVKKAVGSGSKEICLVSQDTVFYGRDTETLKNLLMEISQIEGVELIRPLYLYPDKKTYKLLDAFLENKKIAPYFESPIQHVSEKVLKSMNRSGNLSFFKDLFFKARTVKDLEIRTSIIIGYPGETSEDIDQVLEFIDTVKPEKLALFSFSPQEGTKAFTLSETVQESEKAHRINLIRDLHLKKLEEAHLIRIGKEYDAIVDEVTKKEAIVRRFQDAPEIDEVVFCSPENLKQGMIGKVRITSFSEYDMEGTFIPRETGVIL
jgi:ribosomal protein S12 methylthiotransferase